MVKFKRFILILLLTAISHASYAGPGQRIADTVVSVIEILEDRGETIASVMIDQLSKSSTTRSYTRTLYKNNNYTAVACGDSNFTDVDMTVYRKNSNGDWVQVGKDADSSNTSMVNFDCTVTGVYKFEVKAYSFSSGSTSGYFGFILSFE